MPVNQTIPNLMVAALLALAMLVSCAAKTSAEPFLYSDVEREMNPDVTEAEIANLVAGNTRFAFDMYDWLIQDNDNLIFSPYSLSLALCMAYAGADGEAKTAMADVLHFSLDDETLHAAFNSLDLMLDNLGESVDEEEGQAFTFNTANALWGQEDCGIKDEFLDMLALNYGAGFGQLDFWSDPEGSADYVNGWIADQTEDRITEALSPDSLTPETILLIINAVYFFANWQDQFDPDITREEPFHIFDGDDVTVDMMRQTEEFRYAEGDGWQAVMLPYVGYDASMIIVLPEMDAYERVEAMLREPLYEQIMDDLQRREVHLFMPRFEFRTHLDLAQTLKDMGMEPAFESGFEGILENPPGEPVHIDEVIHEAFIAVDEEGTEAAAVTIVEIMVESAEFEPEEPVEFRVDHPFMFLIVERSTNTILFMGRVLNPA